MAFGVIGVRTFVEQKRVRDEITALQGRVYEARVAADSCRNELAYQEVLFRRFDTLVNDMRGQVDAYESLDEAGRRGVPEAEYEAYMEAFEGYNDSVARWDARVDSLRSTEAVCRRLVEDHNALTDSFRTRLTEEGLMGAGDAEDAVP